MGAFLKQDSGETAGGGNESFGGYSGGSSGGPPGVPSPDVGDLPGVIFGKDDTDIIIVIPKRSDGGGTLGRPETIPPEVTVDVDEIEDSQSPQSPSPDSESDTSDLYVDLTDDSSRDLSQVDFESGAVCTLPRFSLSFDSSLNLNEGYYDPTATDINLVEGDAALNPDQEGETGSGNGGGFSIDRADVELGKKLTDIVDKMAGLDRNVKIEKSISGITAKWNLANKNVLNDTLLSVVDLTREQDFGFYINETNFRDFAESTIPQDQEDILNVAPYDISGFVNSSHATDAFVNSFDSNIQINNVENKPTLTLKFADSIGARAQTTPVVMELFF